MLPSEHPVSYTHLDVYKRQVMDFCMRTPEEDIRKFITKWDLHPENDSCEYFTQEQQMQIDLDLSLIHI